MKLSRVGFPLFAALFVLGCMKPKYVTDMELYGNTFIHIGNGYFDTPDDWITHNLFDSAFQIKLPPYMHRAESSPMRDGCANITFMYRDTTNIDEYHYGRISLDYFRNSLVGFKKSDEYISYSEQKEILAPLVSKALSGGLKIFDQITPDATLLNGPFYESYHIYDRKFFYAYDAFYRRNGHTRGKGPVSCHIFLLMNKTESAIMTVSFHDKDSLLFDNLFNVIKTFKWAKYNE